MAEFLSFDKRTEVNGQTILSVIDGMRGFETSARKILFENGIEDPMPDRWYSQQAWLNAFKQIALKIGDVILINIGKRIPDNARWPEHIDSIRSALESIDIAYHLNHRIGENILFDEKKGTVLSGIGNYTYEEISDNSVKMICNNPYPCSFDKGILKAVALKFKPLGYTVLFKEHVADGCRKRGSDTCTYYISWKKTSSLYEDVF